MMQSGVRCLDSNLPHRKLRKRSFAETPMNTQWLRSSFGRRLMLDRNAEFWLGQLNARWSVRETRARVVRIVAETRDTKTFVLEPNASWRGHRAGQFTNVEV